MSDSKSIESIARDMLWKLYSPMKMDKPEMTILFEWYPHVFFKAILKPVDAGAAQLFVRKSNDNEPKVLDRVVWEENAIIYFKCLNQSSIPSDEVAKAFDNDVFYLTTVIRNMIAKHEDA